MHESQDEIANIRGKDEYELGDLTVALDQIGKDMTCQLTGKVSSDSLNSWISLNIFYANKSRI